LISLDTSRKIFVDKKAKGFLAGKGSHITFGALLGKELVGLEESGY